MTIQGLFDLAWEIHWSQPRYHRSRWALEVDKLYRRNIAPVFGEKDVRSIKGRDVRAWLRTFSEKPYAGNRSLEVLSKMFNLAIEEEHAEINPCTGVKSLGERKRNRYATEDEIRALKTQLEIHTEKHPLETAFILTLMYTGARPLSIVTAKRKDINCLPMDDGTWGRLYIEGKSTADSGVKETILLPPKIMQLLLEIPPPRDGTFFGIPFPRAFWNKIRKTAGCEDLWARDWRRTFASIGLQSGVSLDTIGELLNHQSTQTTKLYAKLNDAPRAVGVRLVSDRLDAISG